MEWEIVTVMIALLGLIATVTKPIMNLTNTITKLNDTCEHLESKMEKFENHNHDSHVRLWNHKGKKSVFLVWIGGDSVGGCWSKTRNVYQLGNIGGASEKSFE